MARCPGRITRLWRGLTGSAVMAKSDAKKLWLIDSHLGLPWFAPKDPWIDPWIPFSSFFPPECGYLKPKAIESSMIQPKSKLKPFLAKWHCEIAWKISEHSVLVLSCGENGPSQSLTSKRWDKDLKETNCCFTPSLAERLNNKTISQPTALLLPILHFLLHQMFGRKRSLTFQPFTHCCGEWLVDAKSLTVKCPEPRLWI